MRFGYATKTEARRAGRAWPRIAEPVSHMVAASSRKTQGCQVATALPACIALNRGTASRRMDVSRGGHHREGTKYNDGASRRRAAPRSQSGQASRRLTSRGAGRQWTEAQEQGLPIVKGGHTCVGCTSLGYRATKLFMSSHRAKKPLPNMSVNRTRYGKAPWPRGSQGSSSASRPGRPASAGRLPLR